MYYPFLGLNVFYYFQQYLQDILSAKLRLVAEKVCWNFFDLLYCFESLSESRGNVRGANLGVMWLVGTLKGCSHLLIASDSEFGNFIQSDHNFSLLRFKLWLDPQEIDGYQNKKKKKIGDLTLKNIYLLLKFRMRNGSIKLLQKQWLVKKMQKQWQVKKAGVWSALVIILDFS